MINIKDYFKPYVLRIQYFNELIDLNNTYIIQQQFQMSLNRNNMTQFLFENMYEKMYANKIST